MANSSVFKYTEQDLIVLISIGLSKNTKCDCIICKSKSNAYFFGLRTVWIVHSYNENTDLNLTFLVTAVT